MELPKVSIVVPIYNAELYIENCLKCLRNQTYKNIEIICVDDGSTDKSAEIVKKQAERDGRITLLMQKNAGVAQARNTGLSALTGKYVMFCDADDYFQWEAVEICVKHCLAHKHCDAVFFNARMFTISGNSYTAMSGEQYACIPEEMDGESSNFLGIFACVWSGLFSVSIIKENNIAFRKGYIYEDWDFVVRFNSYAEYIYWFNCNLYNYRWDQKNSISGNVSKKCLDIFVTWSTIKQSLEKAERWNNNQYSFYIKALEHIVYFKRDRLIYATDDVKKAYEENATKFIQEIPYSMLCSLMRFFPMEDRVSILSVHQDHDVEVNFCIDNLRRQERSRIKVKIKNFLKKIMMSLFPSYRVATNTRFETEQMYGEIMGKLNEITYLQYENQNNINLIFHKLGMDSDEKIMEEILIRKENEKIR